MEELNQFAISKILGSKIKQVAPLGFGSFSSVSTAEEIQNALRGDMPRVEPPSFSHQQDADFVEASEDVGKGAPTDE